MSTTSSKLRGLLNRFAAVCLVGFAVGTAYVVSAQTAQSPKPAQATQATQTSQPANTARAIFAGGCFWCVESDFDKIPGVISTTSGYIGGSTANPTYEQVSSNSTGHAEAVEIVYDPSKVSYQRLVQYFWHTIDPTVKNQQFCDHGSPYRSAIFAVGTEQLQIAQASKAALEKSKPFKDPIVTEIVAAGAFYPAEDYHQDYYLKNPVRYKYYRSSCGRDARLQTLWGASAGK
jgi:peptide-methionine (S)-S-oxide reductase